MRVWMALVVCACVALLWGRGIGGGYQADDFSYATFGAALGELPFFDSVRWFWTRLPEEMGLRFYRPLIGFSYSLEHRWLGDTALVRRVVNLLLHAGSAVLLGAVVGNLLRARGAADRAVRGGALAAGVLFAVSPAHPESVLWISCRVNLLATACGLLAVWAFLRRQRSGVRGWTVVGLIGTLLAAWSKETGVVVAPLLVVLHASGLTAAGWDRPSWRATLVATWPYFAVLGWYLWLRWLALGELVGGGYLRDPDFASLDYWLSRLELLGLIAGPVHLGQWDWPVKAGLVVVVVALLAAGASRSRPRARVAWVAAFVLTLVPVYSAPFDATTLQDSRIAYEPTAVLVAGLALALVRLAGTRHWVESEGAALLLALGFGIIAVGNAAPWLRMGAVSAGLHAQLLEWQAEGTLEELEQPRWIVDLPVVVDGAYLFLGAGEPLVHPELTPASRAKLRGVRDNAPRPVLERALRGAFDVWRPDWRHGHLQREVPESWIVPEELRVELGVGIARLPRRRIESGNPFIVDVLLTSDAPPDLALELRPAAGGPPLRCPPFAAPARDGRAVRLRCLPPPDLGSTIPPYELHLTAGTASFHLADATPSTTTWLLPRDGY